MTGRQRNWRKSTIVFVLQITRKIGRSFETKPENYVGKDEEGIRDSFYLVLKHVLKVAQQLVKTIEPHRLKALIEEDLKLHPNSTISEIAERLPDVDRKDIQRQVYNMTRQNLLTTTGGKTNRRYSLA